jgi:AraC-like DNA-binding protein
MFLRFLTCKFWIPLILLAIQSNFILAQNPVTFIITTYPDYTPKTDSLYFVTSADNWVNDPHKKFKFFPNGTFRLTIDLGELKSFDYKINRGNWNKVEGNQTGEYRENRHFIFNDTITELKISIDSWQDLHDLVFPSVNVIVQSVPKNTPDDASIYISGNFNNWTINDPATKLTKDITGVYKGVIPAGFKDLQFKFTRGSWESVECRWDGGMRSNRVFNAEKNNNKQLNAKIESWDDLSTGNLWIRLTFLIFIMQSFAITMLLMYYRSSKVLVYFSGLLTLAFLAIFLYAYHNLFRLIPFVYLLPVAIYTFIGQLMYIWFQSAMSHSAVKINLKHFLPVIPLLWFIQYLRFSNNEFYLKVVNNELNVFVYGAYAYSLVLNFYLNRKLSVVISKNIAAIPDLTYSLYRAILINFYLSAFVLVVFGIGIWQGIDPKFAIDWLNYMMWLGIGVAVLYYQYYFFTSIYNRYTNKFGAKKEEILNKDVWATLKNKLTELMETKAIYSNPNLSLSDIAGEIGTNKHYISRLINEGFKKNFTDYVNEYRIKAFIEAVGKDKNNNTFLYHAFDVGFNSKSSFNRAFKKMTNKTPSEYFQ